MDGAELKQLLEEYSPGPRLVPGSEAAPGSAASATGDDRTSARFGGRDLTLA